VANAVESLGYGLDRARGAKDQLVGVQIHPLVSSCQAACERRDA
jgi:precorrin-6B methylase 1